MQDIRDKVTHGHQEKISIQQTTLRDGLGMLTGLQVREH